MEKGVSFKTALGFMVVHPLLWRRRRPRVKNTRAPSARGREEEEEEEAIVGSFVPTACKQERGKL